MDVLENGPASRFARFFDIEWRPVKDELADKVLIPILGDQYGEVLERQELSSPTATARSSVRYHDDCAADRSRHLSDDRQPDLEAWLARHPSREEADELQSILTAAHNLPPRGDRTPEAIAVRAREKEIVKRRLAGLVDAACRVRALVDASVVRINGVAGQPRSFDRARSSC